MSHMVVEHLPLNSPSACRSKLQKGFTIFNDTGVQLLALTKEARGPGFTPWAPRDVLYAHFWIYPHSLLSIKGNRVYDKDK